MAEIFPSKDKLTISHERFFRFSSCLDATSAKEGGSVAHNLQGFSITRTMEVRVIGGVITPQCIVAIPKQNVNKNYLTSVNKSKLRKEKFAPFVTQRNVSI